MDYRYRRRADDFCKVRVARWQGVLIGWTSFLTIALLDLAVRG